MGTFLQESTCALHCNPPDTLRELWGWLKGTAAGTAPAIGAHTRAGASGEQQQGPDPQAPWGCVWGLFLLLLPPARAVGTTGPHPPMGAVGGGSLCPALGSRISAMLHGAVLRALPNPNGE